MTNIFPRGGLLTQKQKDWKVWGSRNKVNPQAQVVCFLSHVQFGLGGALGLAPKHDKEGSKKSLKDHGSR